MTPFTKFITQVSQSPNTTHICSMQVSPDPSVRLSLFNELDKNSMSLCLTAVQLDVQHTTVITTHDSAHSTSIFQSPLRHSTRQPEPQFANLTAPGICQDIPPLAPLPSMTCTDHPGDNMSTCFHLLPTIGTLSTITAITQHHASKRRVVGPLCMHVLKFLCRESAAAATFLLPGYQHNHIIQPTSC